MVIATALSLMGVACSNLDRSRDLSNPLVRPEVTAVQVCSNCHGIDGNSKSPNFPRLAGQQKAYLVTQLEGFRNHHRADPEGFEYMWGIASKLDDAQINGLADYFSKQTPKPIPGATASAEHMAAGKAIFENGLPEKEVPPCGACHQADANGMASFPRLAWQHQDYMMKQLQVFRETEGRPGTPMKQVTHQLSDPEMKSVTLFLQSFPQPK
jgi:cytochrome c553